MTDPNQDVRAQFDAWFAEKCPYTNRLADEGEIKSQTCRNFASKGYQSALQSPAVRDLVEALGKAVQFVEAHSEESGYGFARPTNPHDFSPDLECCTDEEVANHRAACEAFDRGDYQHDDWDGWNADRTIHVLQAPWGIGGYTMRDQWAEETLSKASAALRTLGAGHVE